MTLVADSSRDRNEMSKTSPETSHLILLDPKTIFDQKSSLYHVRNLDKLQVYFRCELISIAYELDIF